MVNFKPLLLIFIFFFICFESHCQMNNDLNLIIKCNYVNTSIEQSYSGKTGKPENISEVKFLFLGLIKFYQIFISSQQSKQICVFKPSCSHFGQEAIHKYGLFYGILMSSDRLQRCNGFGIEYYKIDIESGKCLDSVDNYYIGRKE